MYFELPPVILWWQFFLQKAQEMTLIFGVFPM